MFAGPSAKNSKKIFILCFLDIQVSWYSNRYIICIIFWLFALIFAASWCTHRILDTALQMIPRQPTVNSKAICSLVARVGHWHLNRNCRSGLLSSVTGVITFGSDKKMLWETPVISSVSVDFEASLACKTYRVVKHLLMLRYWPQNPNWNKRGIPDNPCSHGDSQSSHQPELRQFGLNSKMACCGQISLKNSHR